ncbi:hypothetical protein, partial [Salmonella sp. s54395]|uniref:hypothetical protein n=1 Tax=Salmonella sp. s54395 TaxID=3159664 RepID=UPI00397FD0DE
RFVFEPSHHSCDIIRRFHSLTMPQSGIAVSDDVLTTFRRIKKEKDLHYIKYAMNDAGTMVEVLGTKTTSEDFDYEKLGDLFSPEECCYVVMDIKW